MTVATARTLLAAAFVFSLVAPGQAAAAVTEEKLFALDAAADDHLGGEVAIEGDTAAMLGFPGTESWATEIYVFTRSDGAWANTGKLTASDSDGRFVSLTLLGNQVIAGAQQANGEQGAVYTFATTGPYARTETAKLVAPGSHYLGSAVAAQGDQIVAGAMATSAGASATGAVYTFAATGPPDRPPTAQLLASDRTGGDSLGSSVAIDGDVIVAGAELEDVGANQSQGAIYTFPATGPSPRPESAKLIASDGRPDDFLGREVAIAAGQVVGGAPNEQLFGAQGAAYTFAASATGTQHETAKLTASDAALDDGFGLSIAASAERILIGAGLATVGSNPRQGALYSFAPAGGSRKEVEKIVSPSGASFDGFAADVAMSGDRVLAGVPLDDDTAGAEQGSGSVLSLSSGSGGGPTGPGGGASPDTDPPETRIVKSPKKELPKSTAKFVVSSDEPGSAFECRLKGKEAKKKLRKFRPCTEKTKFKKLDDGKFKFAARAVDAAGNVDPTPVKKKFKVIEDG